MITSFYDSVKLYTIALKEAIEKKLDINNPFDITKLMWNRSFTSVTDRVIRITENGDRKGDFALLDFDLETLSFKKVGTYTGSDGNYIPELEQQIDWIREGPPPDTPACGFDGEKCRDKEQVSLIVGLVMLGLSFITIVFAVLFIRHAKMKSDLKAMSWLIERDQLKIKDQPQSPPAASTKNFISKRFSNTQAPNMAELFHSYKRSTATQPDDLLSATDGSDDSRLRRLSLSFSADVTPRPMSPVSAVNEPLLGTPDVEFRIPGKPIYHHSISVNVAQENNPRKAKISMGKKSLRFFQRPSIGRTQALELNQLQLEMTGDESRDTQGPSSKTSSTENSSVSQFWAKTSTVSAPNQRQTLDEESPGAVAVSPHNKSQRKTSAFFLPNTQRNKYPSGGGLSSKQSSNDFEIFGFVSSHNYDCCCQGEKVH
ncbi:Nitrogen permease regulator 2 [Cichlidogyrus casuarinus]|uniref:Nitrogen permease regulator 2 n=1 Tax=Cichlidogyrus casuarinus TaxID=1844966 RepID=A0ABD2QF29_9PLAT